VGSQPRFAVADYYRNWHDLSDEEVFKALERWKASRFKTNIKPPKT
jgi:predicted phosphoribosyltransferase